MKKILLPTDYSKPAKRAIEYALRLFQHLPKEEVEFILVHAYSAPATVPVYGHKPPGDITPPVEEEEKRLKSNLLSWKELYPEVAIRPQLLIGSILTVLDSLIREENIDLVIMGTKGASGVEEMLLGSNAARAAKSLPCPVLIIPEAATFRSPERIVFATDFEKLDDLHILDPLRTIVRHFDPHFLTLHVLPEGKTPDAQKEAISSDLRTYFDSTHYSHHYLEGKSTIKAIDAFIDEHHADWLALIGKERGFFESIFHRSVVKKMAFHTKIPLLVLKDYD